MDIWLIQNGEKTGPLPDYEVRRRISAGRLQRDTHAWHEGLDAWRPLAEVPLFRDEFDPPTSLRPPPLPTTPPPVPRPAGGPVASPTLAPGRPLWLRRFFARWFDLYLFATCWWFAMWWLGRDLGELLLNPVAMITMYLPWVAVEAWLIQRFGCTPGKWLLGLRVLNSDGSRLDLSAAIRRSLVVLAVGVGFGWGIVAVLCQALSLFAATRLGKPLWDVRGGHEVLARPLRRYRAVALGLGLFASMHLQLAVKWPYMEEQMAEAMPALYERVREHPPWHLPKR